MGLGTISLELTVIGRNYLMKKLFILGLAAIMTVAFTTLAMASTMGVNVEKGYTLSIERDEIYSDATAITGNLGLSDNFLLTLGYVTNADYYTVGGRFEIVNNLALGFNYGSEPDDADDDSYTVDLRGKLDLSNQLALVGKAAYTEFGDDKDFTYTGQAEYAVTDSFIPTFAVAYKDPDEGDSTTTYTLGMDVYPTDKFFVYLDYAIDKDDSADNEVYLGVEFAF